MTRGCQGNTGLMLSPDLGGQGGARRASESHTFTVTGPGSKLSQESHWAEAEEGWSRDCGSSRLQGVLLEHEKPSVGG